jgi:hypothetical protein
MSNRIKNIESLLQKGIYHTTSLSRLSILEGRDALFTVLIVFVCFDGQEKKRMTKSRKRSNSKTTKELNVDGLDLHDLKALSSLWHEV